MSKPLFFCFGFDWDCEDTTYFRFEVKAFPGQTELGERGQYDDEFLEDCIDICQELDLESYGVHDVEGSSFKDWDEDGFNSYEVEPDKWMELMEVWHKALSDKGYILGPILDEPSFLVLNLQR